MAFKAIREIFDVPVRPIRLSETKSSHSEIIHCLFACMQGFHLARRRDTLRSQDISGAPISVIDCDYLPDPSKTTFPPELALLIVRKAASMAAAFEQQALDQLTKDAISAISAGADPRQVIRQMRL